MDATHVYHIVLALPSEEQERLYDMMGTSLKKPSNFKKKHTKTPDFNVDDGIRFLLKKLFN